MRFILLMLAILFSVSSVSVAADDATKVPAAAAKENALPAPKKVFTFPHVTVNRDAREMRVEATLSDEAYLLEFFLIYDGDPALDRGYESVFLTKAQPAHIHLGLMMLGLLPGPLAKEAAPNLTKSNREHVQGERAEMEKTVALAPMVEILVEWTEKDGVHQARGESFMYNREISSAAENSGWGFTGSYLVTHEGKKVMAASRTYVIASVFNDESAVLNLPYFTKNPHRDPQERPDGSWGMVLDAKHLPRHFRTSRTFRVGKEMVTKPYPKEQPVTLIFHPAAEKKETAGKKTDAAETGNATK